MMKPHTLEQALNQTSKRFKTRVIDSLNNLLASPVNESAKEAAIYRYGNCEVLIDRAADGIRVIKIDTSKKRRVFL